MRSNLLDGREAVFAALEALEADADVFAGLSFEALSEMDCVLVMSRLMTIARKVPAWHYELVNQLGERAVPSDIGGPLPRVLADRLKIRPSAARRLISDAGQLGHRRALSGEPLEPLWPTTASKARAGEIGAEHVAIIRNFFHQLPASYPAQERDRDEQMLGEMAAQLRPDQLQQAADRMAALINPDGTFSDLDRAPQARVFLGRPRMRRDESGHPDRRPAAARHPGRGDRQTGRPGHVQSRGPDADGGRGAARRIGARRYPHPRAARP